MIINNVYNYLASCKGEAPASLEEPGQPQQLAGQGREGACLSGGPTRGG